MCVTNTAYETSDGCRRECFILREVGFVLSYLFPYLFNTLGIIGTEYSQYFPVIISDLSSVSLSIFQLVTHF